MSITKSPLARIMLLVREEKNEISSIYLYAILGGLIQLSLPLGVQAIVGFVMGGTMSTSIVLLITLVVAGVLSNGLLQMQQMKLIERIQQKLFVRYAFAFADHIPQIDLQKTDRYYLPELVNHFFEVPILQKSISKILLEFPIAIIQILFGLILVSLYHPVFIPFSLLLLAILVLIFYVTGNKGVETSLVKSHYKYAVAGWLEELARVIQSFKFHKHASIHVSKSDSKIIDYLTARKKHFSILLLQYHILVAFKVIITAAMLITGCILLLNQQINIGQFVAAEIVILLVINSIEKLVINIDHVYSVLTAADKIEKLIDQPIERNGSYVLHPTTGLSISLTNVTFGYRSDQSVLTNFSAIIPANQRVCIAGPDGAGKSTLLKLLTGTYRDYTGTILINDLPIGNYELESLRIQTGILLNQQAIFQGTLWENLTMNEGIDKNYVVHLCHRIGLSPFIATLKEGLDTFLAPSGMRLPRNVVQKILLVRALASKPKLLLLEEPWQGIEEQYSKQIQDLLLYELQDTTVLVSSNDKTFQQKCSQVITLASSTS